MHIIVFVQQVIQMPVHKLFLIFNLGVFLLFCGIAGTIALVSSINVEDGLGTSSLAVAFGSSVVAAFVTPALIRNIGCRLVIIMAEFGYLIFVICNVYSSYNLIVGGVFYGIGEAIVWTAFPTIASRFAGEHSSVGSKTVEVYRNSYIGYLFAGVQTSLIFGNAAGALMLYIDRSLSNRLNATHNVDLSVCGANDCQDRNYTLANLEQYSPAFPATRYIVITVFSLFIVVAMLLHGFFLPDDYCNQKKNSEQFNSDGIDVNLKNECADEKKVEAVEAVELIAEVKASSSDKLNAQSGCTHFKSSLYLSFKLFFLPKQLLVFLLPIYNGLTMGLVVGELTRSYASCILGLDKVALGAMLFGFTDALMSYVAGKVAGKYGRNLPYAFAFLLDIANYVFCLVWVVNKNNVALVYVLFLSFGVTDGIWQTLINVMYEEYFSVQPEIAFNLWNVLVNVGTFIQFAISVHFCVYQKIYLQIAVLCTAVTTYGISQFVYRRK